MTLHSATPTHPKAVKAQAELRRIATVALLSIALGFFMQVLILASRLLAGAALPGITILADLAQGITWSFFVCTGVAIGVAIGKARKALAGLMGVIFAPLGIALSKSAQKAMLVALDAAEQPALLSLTTIGLVRAVEYGILAWVLAIFAEKELSRPLPYLGVGAAVGIVFGVILAALTWVSLEAAGKAFTAPQLAGTLVNEIGSPIGCAFIVFIGQLVALNFKIYKAHVPAAAK